jgi:AcrR family transcriptional regulator
MGRPQKSNGQRTRQAILDAALHLFAEEGFFGTSLRGIAASVGIRESALYNYFPSKEALFEALIVTDQQSMGERLSGVMDGPISDVRLTLTRLAVRALDDFATPRQQQLFCILMSDGIRLAKDGRINLFERMSCGRARMSDLMRRLVRDGWLGAGDPELLALAFMAPLLVWRHMHAVGLEPPATRHRRAFARHHVNGFLLGAMARPSEGVSRGETDTGARAPRESANHSTDVGFGAQPALNGNGASIRRHTSGRKRTGTP